MVTPATTASSVSAPPRIISSARSQARSPLALEITTSLPEGDCAAAADIAAEVRNQFLRVSMTLLWREEAPRRNSPRRVRERLAGEVAAGEEQTGDGDSGEREGGRFGNRRKEAANFAAWESGRVDVHIGLHVSQRSSQRCFSTCSRSPVRSNETSPER